MARGGLRPGAGRPKGARPLENQPVIKAPVGVCHAARQSGMTPLDYMLTVMQDEAADPLRRDRMAIAAAGYVHAKPGDVAKGKKKAAEEAAQTAGHGTEWGEDLAGPVN